MNVTQKTLAALLVSSTALVSAASAAEISGNVGLTNDYIWRGMSQNDGGTSASGGLDVAFENGAYVGTWVGDTAGTDYGTQELDYYFGYAGESGSLSYDIGYIAYTYPSSQSADDVDFSEVYATVGSGPISASVYYLVSADDADAGDSVYASVDYETEVEGFGLTLHYGSYTGDFVGEDKTDISVTLSKDDFSFGFVTADGDDLSGADEDLRFVVSWGASF